MACRSVVLFPGSSPDETKATAPCIHVSMYPSNRVSCQASFFWWSSLPDKSFGTASSQSALPRGTLSSQNYGQFWHMSVVDNHGPMASTTQSTSRMPVPCRDRGLMAHGAPMREAKGFGAPETPFRLGVCHQRPPGGGRGGGTQLALPHPPYRPPPNMTTSTTEISSC